MAEKLVENAARQLHVTDFTYGQIMTPEVRVPTVEAEGGTFTRTRDYVPGEDEVGDTQGGWRAKVIDDSKLSVDELDWADIVEVDRRESEVLALDMTIKLGFMQRCLREGLERGLINPAFRVLKKAGGAKAVASILLSSFDDPAGLERFLHTTVDGYHPNLGLGDGIAPDKRVKPSMMLTMARRATRYNDKYLNHFTCKPDKLAGKFDSTGALGVMAVDEMGKAVGDELPREERTVIIQGLGAAGGPAEKTVQRLWTPRGYRVIGIGDHRNAYMAKNPDEGLIRGRDYQVDSSGEIGRIESTMRHIEPAELLLETAGVKLLAATEDAVHKGNYQSVMEGTRRLGVIANGGVEAETALAIETEYPEAVVAPVPFDSGGGVITSLVERYKDEIERELGRELTEDDMMAFLGVISSIGAELLLEESDHEDVGHFTGAYMVGLREQYLNDEPIAAA